MTDGTRTSPFTVEIQQQFDPLAQTWQQHVFVKLYTAALAGGFLGAISDRDWKTLCVIALHMDAQGRCYPSRDHIARALGVDASTASHRIRSLLQFRWQGQPLVRAQRLRGPDGRLGRQVYTILPNSPLGFGPPSPIASSPTEEGAPTLDMFPNAQESETPSEPSPGGDSATWQDRHMDQVAISPRGEIATSYKQDPLSKQELKDLTDPSTSSKSQDLAAKPRDASVGVGPVASEPAPPPGGANGALHESPQKAVQTEARDSETDAPKSEPANPTTLSAGRRSSPDAKQLADRLKQRLQERGVTVFPRDWHLKAQASAQHLLATLSMAQAEALMDWALAHPFWGTKITDLYRIVALAPEWQQARHPGKGGPTDGPNRLPTSLTAGRHYDQGSLDALIQGP